MRSNTIKNYFHFLLRGSVESFHHKTFLATLGIPASLARQATALWDTRRIFILGDKVGRFVAFLGLHVQIGRIFDICKPVSSLFIPKKSLQTHQEY